MYRTLDEMVEAARSQGPVRMAVAAGHSPECIAALKQAREMNLAEGIFIGDSKKIWAHGRRDRLRDPGAPDAARGQRRGSRPARRGDGARRQRRSADEGQARARRTWYAPCWTRRPVCEPAASSAR